MRLSKRAEILRARASGDLLPRKLNFEPLEVRMLLSINSAGIEEQLLESQGSVISVTDGWGDAGQPELLGSPRSLLGLPETESNDTLATAQPVPLGFDDGEDFEIDIEGTLAGDSDFFSMMLDAGDIFGANVSGAGTELTFHRLNPVEILLIGSTQDSTALHPNASPLPGGGNAALSWVVDTPGQYFIGVSGGAGDYELNLRLFRPALEKEDVGTRQTLFLDFDGATLNTPVMGSSAEITLSPFSHYLRRWGLRTTDEDALIDTIVETVQENLSFDVRQFGNNGDYPDSDIPGEFDIKILNSRDHDDTFGQSHVSRVIVGGTVDQLGLPVIGFAQSIDVGNFETEETAITLLDQLSEASTHPNSLNQFTLAPGVSKIDLVGVGVGNIVSREAGHLFGNWETDASNGLPNIMDEEGSLANIIGLSGPFWGDGDEVDVDFGDDSFASSQGFTGTENTLNVVSFGLSTGTMGPELVAINPNTGEVLLDGDLRSVAMQELLFRFNEGEEIDPESIADGIQIIRAGGPVAPNMEPVFDDGNDIVIIPGFIDIGEFPNEVIIRFADDLPDDRYRITIFGTGATPLVNANGAPLNGGSDQVIEFELDLGAQVISVVPQPTIREPLGGLSQARDQIVVYFNQDDLHTTAVETGQEPTDPTVVDPQFYQLIFTNDTVNNTDDEVFHPTSVSYDPATDMAVLTFASDIALLSSGPGTYRLRVGTNEDIPQAPTRIDLPAAQDPGSSFDSAHALGNFGAESMIISSAIEPTHFPMEFPGAISEPGHREIVMDKHTSIGPDVVAGISTIFYNFRSDYGRDPDGNPLFNVITPSQKDLARQIFEIYSHYLGVEFVESATMGVTVATGDLRAINPLADSGPNGPDLATASDALSTEPIFGSAVLNASKQWDDTFGGNWFSAAFTGISFLLRGSYSEELPPLTVQGNDLDLVPDGKLNDSEMFEPVFPGDHDIVHGRHLYRPEGNDIDLYELTVDQRGIFSAETIAERLDSPSTLDTVISLYEQDSSGFRLISRNDNYFSEDSFLKMELRPDITYIVGVSASGNTSFDPSVPDSGNYGTSDGEYELRLNFRPLEAATIVDIDAVNLNEVDIHTIDVDKRGTIFDGDSDGVPGGVHNFWFRTQTPSQTLIVDKSALGSLQTGSLANPFTHVSSAFAAAVPGDIVRIVGNKIEGFDPADLTSTQNSQAYLFGVDELDNPLEDGQTVKIPRGVTLMIDAGTIIKSQDAVIEVGSSAATIDRSGGVLQVLGTPNLPVFFTSYNDEQIGQDTNPNITQSPMAGDWGGILIRNDLDRASPDRLDWEARGIFLNHINHADMRFGGGLVEVASREQIITPIQMLDARPTVTFNSISSSLDAALSASPNSFEETNFNAPQFQEDPFTSDYDRVGPDVYGNSLSGNSFNSLFVRVRTPAGDELQPLKVAGRLDDTDVVHTFSENLVIQGTPGGHLLDEQTQEMSARLDASLVIDPGVVVKLDSANIVVGIGAQLVAEGVQGRDVIITSLPDDTFGAGGIFDTTGDGDDSVPNPGDWGGLYFGHVSTGSLDHARVRHGGGVTRLESGFAGFNVIEIQQANVRITNSIVEHNSAGQGGQAPEDRFGMLSNDEATIFVRGAQPIIADNIVRNNQVAAININANALNHFITTDIGRSTGHADLLEGYADNQGALVRGNQLANNGINGMVVRGGTLTTQVVMDDTDIVHVVLDEIVVPDFHTFGGVRLESSPNESLVVKFSGPVAGLTASGRPLEIDDRIGGSVQIIGQPGKPVILTGLADDTVGAGFEPDGTPQVDTNNDGLFTTISEDDGTIEESPGPVDVTSTTMEANELRDILIGPGIEAVGNAVFVGGATSAGFFEGGSDSIGIPNGIILTSGDANLASGPNNDDGATGLASQVGDLDLDAAFNTATQDTTYLQFDFQTTGGDLFFSYVFASEEYNEFVNSIFNDVFGFFLDGENIALVPGTTTPVTINSINNGNPLGAGATNPQFYNNNDLDEGALFTTQLEYDGFTDVLIAQALDIGPGVHTIKLAVSDVGDQYLDTGVFIRAGSFSDQPIGTVPQPGDWRGLKIEQNGNDRNVAVYTEQELAELDAPGSNATANNAEFMGMLAPHEKAGDDNLRLGFEVHGFLSAPDDMDVFSFEADAGTEVWLDIDRSTTSLDTVLELIDRDGNVIARSNNSVFESTDSSTLTDFPDLLAQNQAMVMQKLPPFGGEDYFASNPKDAGMRVALPEAEGTNNTYHVRVRSDGETFGAYQLQVRLREMDEIPGSVVQHADIRYAINGVEVIGQPYHTPLLGEAIEDGSENNTLRSAQDLGNVLLTDRGVISVNGQLGEIGDLLDLTDIDYYKFEIRYEDTFDDTQANYAGTVIDVDYGDGFSRPDTLLFVFNANGELILWSDDSNVVDDRPAGTDGDIDDLSRGSLGPLDPYIGTVALPEGEYFVAVMGASQLAQELDQFTSRTPTNALVRVEPINSVQRIAEEHFGGISSTANEPVLDVLIDEASIVPFALPDVRLFVATDVDVDTSQLYSVNPFTGLPLIQYPEFGADIGDLAMLDGQLRAFQLDLEDDDGGQDDKAGNFLWIDTGTADFAAAIEDEDAGGFILLGDDGIATFQVNEETGDPEPRPDGTEDPGLQGIHFEAMTFLSEDKLIAVGNAMGEPAGVELLSNILYGFTGDGVADPNPAEERVEDAATDAIEIGEIITNVIMEVAGGDALVDGTSFTIDGVVFEFEDIENAPGAVNPSAILLPLNAEDDAAAVANAVATAINDTLGPELAAEVDPDNFVQITGMLGPAVVDAPFAAVGDGGPGGMITGLAHMIDVTMEVVGGDALSDGVTFLIDEVEFEFNDIASASGTNKPNSILVPFDVTDDVATVANAVATAISDEFGVSARADADNILHIPSMLGAPTVDAPLSSDVSEATFAVSATGGLWQLDIEGPAADYLEDSAADLVGLEFAGLTAGPGRVEDGLYADTLFGITSSGTLVAFDTSGILKPVLVNAQSSVETGLLEVKGLAFSNLEENLWHETDQRGTDPGHGVTQPFDLSREAIDGENSLYFGRRVEEPELPDYDMPGGSHGVVVTHPFDLSEYSANDQPFAYFNYLALTENVDASEDTPMRDSFRVYGTDGSGLLGSGEWHLLATNNSLRNEGEYDEADAFSSLAVEVQELHDFTDSPGTWRQARIPLHDFAGRKDVRLRFEFATDGTLDLGNPNNTGSELRVVAGSELQDGDTFSVGSTQFEFESGITLNLSSGGLLNDGDYFSIDSLGGRTYFEFDSDGNVGSALLVGDVSTFLDGQTFQISDGTNTQRFEFDSGFSILVPPAGGNPFLGGIEAGDVFLLNNNTGSGDIVFEFNKEGLPASGDVLIDISDLSSQDEIADLIVEAIEGSDLGLSPTHVGNGVVHLGGIVHTTSTTGAVTHEGYDVVVIPIAGGNEGTGGIAAGDQFVINDNAGSGDMVFQFTKAGLPGTGDFNIEVSDTNTQEEIANRVMDALRFAGMTPENLGSGKIAVGAMQHSIDTSGSAFLRHRGEPTPQNDGKSISFAPTPDLKPSDLADFIAAAINASGLDVVASTGSNEVILEGNNIQFIPGSSPFRATDRTTIPFSDQDTSAKLASLAGNAIQSTILDVTPHVSGSHVNLQDVLNVDISTNANIGIVGQIGAQSFDSLLIPVHPGLTADEVAVLVKDAIASGLGFGLQIVTHDGSRLSEGDTITISDDKSSLTVEFDSGYSLVIPDTGGAGIVDGESFTISNIATTFNGSADTTRAANLGHALMLLIPAVGGDETLGGLRAGDEFVLNNSAGSDNVLFQFTKNGIPATGDVNIPILDTSTQDEIADLVVNAIQGAASLNLAPENLGIGRVLVGGLTHTVDTTGTLNLLSGLDILVPPAGGDSSRGGIDAAYQFVINDNVESGDVIFQFTKNGFPNTGDVNIPISDQSTQAEVADAIAAAVASAGLGLTPTNTGNGVVALGVTTHTVETVSSANLG
ncbi:MAG: MBL fold metallo-hydrolase, partial [Pirellulaceae bacterium]|nr:MBL fold metallo-hydrolase [Pirellulaceae bacterium]